MAVTPRHLCQVSGTRELLVSLLDGGDPPEDLVAIVTARTEGNPFFVEEIVNSLIETGVLVNEPGGWLLRKQLDDAAVHTIVVEAVPDDEAWSAVADRLKRGSSRPESVV